MIFTESLALAFDSLRAHRLRSFLTMLGVVFGVGAVIAMLSIGAGAEQQSLATISRLGLHNVIVTAKTMREETLREARAKSPGLTFRDAEALAEAIPGVALVAPQVKIEPRRLFAENEVLSSGFEVIGVEPRYAELVKVDLAEGRFLDPRDGREHAQVAVIGSRLRRDLFGGRPARGGPNKVDDLWLEVIGVLAADPGGGQAIGADAGRVYVPIETAQRKFEQKLLASPLSRIVVKLKEADGGQRAAAQIDALLERLHGGVDDYELIVPEALLAESRRTQQLFNLVMGCIAGISLLVGGIGIMNILLASILERTREIGVRRAVGAKRQDILRQFLLEAFALSASGGLVGVVLGIAIAKAIAASAGWPTLVQPWAILLSTGVALAVGLASGIYPALRAAKLDPIEALRHE
jgi:putative ABC transport system permease protein